MYIGMRAKEVLLVVVLLSGMLCNGCASDQYIRQTYQQSGSGGVQSVLTAAKAPREGWATDPHLSYALYSYYPVDHRFSGLPSGHFGFNGIYYH